MLSLGKKKLGGGLCVFGEGGGWGGGGQCGISVGREESRLFLETLKPISHEYSW